MPPIRTSRNRKPPPAGFDDLEDTLLEFSNKMKDAENASHEGKKKYEVLWPIFQISHQRESPSFPPPASLATPPAVHQLPSIAKHGKQSKTKARANLRDNRIPIHI